MGLMARIAKHAAGVLRSNDLGESFGFGRVLLVAAAAEIGDVGELGLVGRGVVGVGMRGLRAMAGFAGDMGVPAGGAGLGLIVVAQDTGILARVGDRALTDHVEGAGAVVAVLAESFRDDGGAYNQKETEPGQEDESRANQMA